jgi:hypothetical protein
MSLLDFRFYIDETTIDAACASSSWRVKLGSKKSVKQDWLSWRLGAYCTDHEDFFILPFSSLNSLEKPHNKLEIIAINNFERLPL